MYGIFSTGLFDLYQDEGFGENSGIRGRLNFKANEK
jgi:hypothetical protein